MRRQKSTYLTEHLTNYWTDVHQRFSVGRRMYGNYKTCISFNGRCCGNRLILALGLFADVKIDRLHSLLSHSETKCTIALQVCALIATLIALHRVKKMVKIGPVVCELNRGRK